MEVATDVKCSHACLALISEPGRFAWKCSSCDKRFPIVPAPTNESAPPPPALTPPELAENRISFSE